LKTYTYADTFSVAGVAEAEGKLSAAVKITEKATSIKQGAETPGGLPDRRHREEIDGDELFRVVAAKRSPRLRGRPALALRAVLPNRRRTDL
jgi:hypothetical protein